MQGTDLLTALDKEKTKDGRSIHSGSSFRHWVPSGKHIYLTNWNISIFFVAK